MGISFLYIGRDESTLQDKLLLEPRFDIGLPDEMTVPANSRGPTQPAALGNDTTAQNASSILTGILNRLDNATRAATIPPGFNVSSPYVLAPFNPVARRPSNATTSLLWIPWIPIPAGGFSEGGVAFIEHLIKYFFGAVPRDFKFSKIYSPGGIVLSEWEALIGGISKGFGSKEASEENTEGHHMLRKVLAEG
jgi:hypothetical protein